MKKAKKLPGSALAAIRGEISEPQLAELVAHFVHEAGGMKQLAAILWQVYTNPITSSIVRQRIIDLVLRSMKHVNDRATPRDELGLASEEDLTREAQALLEKMADAEAETESGEPDG